MSFYVNQNCPVCGGIVKSFTQGNICEQCGYCLPENTSVTQTNATDKTYQTADDPTNSKETVGGLYGWICPKCGAVMSPYTSFCPNCTKRNWEITCTTTNTADNSTAKSNLDDLGYSFEVGV